MHQQVIQQVKEQISIAGSLYRTHIKVMALTAAMAIVPVGFLSSVVSSGTSAALGPGHFGGVFAGLLAQLFLVLPLQFTGLLLAQAALLLQMNAAQNRAPMITPGRAWARVLKRALPILFTSLLVVMGTALGLLFFVLPGLWFLYRTMLATPVVVFENRSGVSALRRSSQLVKSAPLAAMYLLGAIGLFSWAIQIVAGMVLPAGLGPVGRPVLDALLLPIPLLAVGLFYQQATLSTATIDRPAERGFSVGETA